ncbi:MAG: hypothetical protein A3F12_06315 [Gammaproteobacteria bacterium RIFCSPHIGHO2_12_FULL_38_14]|nr:MAG: hypothetical protein A3F12_06315 [Gammaproteobacteria bacterium RIFCSPHIGHO2_12_FULL_38_14]
MRCGKCGGKKGGCLCPFSLGIAVGVTSGLFMIAYAWIAATWGVGATVIQDFSSMYPGYTPTWMGGLMGGLWGLLEGFIFGFLIAIFYNFVMCCKMKCCKKSDESCECPPSSKGQVGK